MHEVGQENGNQGGGQALHASGKCGRDGIEPDASGKGDGGEEGGGALRGEVQRPARVGGAACGRNLPAQ